MFQAFGFTLSCGYEENFDILLTFRRQMRYQGTPRNVYRHILLSDIKDATLSLPPELANTPVLSYDPLPPKDSIVSYHRPPRYSILY